MCHRKNLAEHWYLPNMGIFFSKDVVSVQCTDKRAESAQKIDFAE
jgi:hypothetical protein